MYIGKIIKQNGTTKYQTGITLVEVVITILILSIGLLGMAALQNTSLKLSYDSYLRTQASFLAYDLIDRVRANPDETYQLSSSVTGDTGDCYGAVTCSPSQLRQSDIKEWKKQADEILPDAFVELEFDASTNTYTLILGWDDRYEEDIEDEDETKEFLYHFQVEAS